MQIRVFLKAVLLQLLLCLLFPPSWAKENNNGKFCAHINVRTVGFENSADKVARVLAPGDQYLAIKSSSNKREILLSDGIHEFWVQGRDLSLRKGFECDQIGLPKDLKVIKTVNPWSFGIDFGMMKNLEESFYNSFVTEVPDPNQVEGLQNPIVMAVEKGKSSSAGISASKPLGERKKLRVGLRYTESTFKLKIKVNPSDNSPIRLDERADSFMEFKSRYFSLNTGLDFYYLSSFSNSLEFVLSIDGEAGYYQEPVSLVVRTGSVFKATENQIQAGPTGVKVRFLGRAGVLFKKCWRLDMELSQYSELGLRAGYEWSF